MKVLKNTLNLRLLVEFSILKTHMTFQPRLNPQLRVLFCHYFFKNYK